MKGDAIREVVPPLEDVKYPPRTRGLPASGRRCPRPTRPVTAFGGFPPPVECSPGFTRVPTGSCRVRRRRWTSTDQSRSRPAASTGGSRILTGVAVANALEPGHPGVPSYSRTPLARDPLLGLHPTPPRRRRVGPLRFSFGTWASPSVRTSRRWPPSPSVSAVADSGGDVRALPRPQWGLRTIGRVGIKSSPPGQTPRLVTAILGFHWNRQNRPQASSSRTPYGGCAHPRRDRLRPRDRGRL